jgi:hypothetical protein
VTLTLRQQGGVLNILLVMQQSATMVHPADGIHDGDRAINLPLGLAVLVALSSCAT